MMKDKIAEMYAQSLIDVLADRFQLKFREGKTKRKKPPHFLIQFFNTFF